MSGAEVAGTGAGRVEGVAAKVGGWNPFEDTVSFGAVTEDFIFGKIIRVFPLFMKLVWTATQTSEGLFVSQATSNE